MPDPKYRALVADPDSRAREELALALESARFAVTEARDERELSEIVAVAPSGHFRLVVVAFAMPRARVIDGLGRGSPRAPVLIVTGPECEELFDLATALGGTAHMTSHGVAELLETIDDLVFGKTAPARPKFDGSAR
jgi:DNA-binding response OmpR family regulator